MALAKIVSGTVLAAVIGIVMLYVYEQTETNINTAAWPLLSVLKTVLPFILVAGGLAAVMYFF